MKLGFLDDDSQYIMRDILGFSYPLPSCYICETIQMWATRVLAVAQLVTLSVSAPPGFPSSGNGLWFIKPADVWAKEWLPVGNGYLAAMVPGGTSSEATQLNIESLWSGGPFSDKSYNGGNKQPGEQLSTAQAMDSIRKQIFQSPTGDISSISQLGTDAGAYGSYAGAGHLMSGINTTGTVSNYGRYLDLDQGIARTIWTQSGTTYQRTTFCSHPTQSCTQHITSTISTRPAAGLPSLSYSFSSALEQGLPAPNITCLDSNTLRIRGTIEASGGMLYEIITRLHTTPINNNPGPTTQCIQFPVPYGFPPNATLQVKAGTVREAWISWVGGTEYSMDAGNAASGFSFRGADPHTALLNLITPPASGSDAFPAILAQHVADYKAALTDKFSLSLGQTPRLDAPTDVIKAAYKIDAGDRYLEWVLFNYGRYLLASSSRGALPANLQGKWADGYGNAWSADYHSNINIQMNYWAAEMTNLDVTSPLFDYFEKTWAPRGAFTAQVLYNISRGWVTHNEMNVFGHTGMKGPGNTAQWANYPEANAWMMIHVWDHFDYTNDVVWFKAQGWPLLKGVASFHLDKLIPDLHFNDTTLVVSPCNSPEQAPITFGCAHAQQLIWQLFNAIEKGFAASGDTDTAFLEEVKRKRDQMDKGIHIGSWGQLQEWKVDRDSPFDTHRHLSHLIGLYPGYAVAGYDSAIQGTFTKQQVIEAATVSLIHRGNGTGPDADSGWEKAWRAAAWAQLGNADKFYHELSYAVFENFGPNLFSLYNPFDPNPIFQIDANLAYPAALLNALIQAPDVASMSTPLKVTLLPALPKQWPSGSIRGARIRGGINIDLQWIDGRPTSADFRVDDNVVARPVQVVYGGKTLTSFITSSGFTRAINSF
ncbi:putative glycosyl hydrolase family 65, N-terminal domain [Lyophyllum shimeji]|uniref:Glycosyl hydrolase family 65, N-terminal domain n=1 Tax=Lyophyllum shimeji TaxID=47721 RepID=A0A9P3PS60_LYOSH|nr:putative glycosyl hydrolase family 65, N-terminal domain [Lyophyllum shimeji]